MRAFKVANFNIVEQAPDGTTIHPSSPLQWGANAFADSYQGNTAFGAWNVSSPRECSISLSNALSNALRAQLQTPHSAARHSSGDVTM